MSDLIKTSLSLENCSFHLRGERSRAREGLKNDLALKARIFPTRFSAKRPGPAVRWVPPGYRQLAEEPRAGFLGIHHFHPLPNRHFIIWDHSVKQYDAAHFYLSRITKPPFSRRRSNKSLHAVHRRLAYPASPAPRWQRRPLAAPGNTARRALGLGRRSSGVAREGHASPKPAPNLGFSLGTGRKRLSLTASDSPTQATSIS